MGRAEDRGEQEKLLRIKYRNPLLWASVLEVQTVRRGQILDMV